MVSIEGSKIGSLFVDPFAVVFAGAVGSEFRFGGIDEVETELVFAFFVFDVEAVAIVVAPGDELAVFEEFEACSLGFDLAKPVPELSGLAFGDGVVFLGDLVLIPILVDLPEDGDNEDCDGEDLFEMMIHGGAFLGFGMRGLGAAEAIHHRNPDSGFGDGLGHDDVNSGGIELAEAVKKADGSFAQFSFSGAEDLQVCPVGSLNEGAFAFAAVAEESVFEVGVGSEIGGVFDHNQGGRGRVVGGELAGSFDAFLAGEFGSDHFGDGPEVVAGDRAGSEEAENGAFFGHFGSNDGAFEPIAASSAVDYEGDFAAQFIDHRLGGSGAKATEAVGTGGGEGELFAGREHDFVSAHADRNGGESAGDEVWDFGLFWEDEGEGAGPEGFGELADHGVEFLGDFGDEVNVFFATDVDDERIESGAFFDFENLGHRLRVEGMGGEAVDGFGGHSDEFAFFEEGDRFRDGVAPIFEVSNEDLCLHEQCLADSAS